MGKTVIHANGSLKHQVVYAKALAEGMGGEVSFSPYTEADIHVVIGPWFALKPWRYAKTLYVDRAYWGDPDCVSIHWLKDGEKVRTKGRPYREHPKLHPMKPGSKTIYLCDYGGWPTGNFDSVRYHPAQRKPTTTLQYDLDAHQVAIGKRTTALVDAAIQGLRVETDDPHSPVYGITDREQWARDLAWHNWSIDEIRSGEFLNGIGHYHATQ